MRFVFQQSHIWDGAGLRPDPSQPTRTVKLPPGKTTEDARRKLPRPGLGRNWILVETKP